MEARGVVAKVTSKNTSAGVTHSFVLAEEDGKWYGTFTSAAPAEGSYVEFEYKTSPAGWHNVDNKTVKVTAPPQGGDTVGLQQTAVVSAQAATAFRGTSNKDANIQWQSARNASINLMVGAAEAGILDLGAKKDGKLEALLILVNRATVDFFDQSMEVSATGDAPEDFRG